MAVVDDGVGFDAQAAVGKGLGLLSMNERATTAGGTLRIHSRPGETRIEARVPAAPRESGAADVPQTAE